MSGMIKKILCRVFMKLSSIQTVGATCFIFPGVIRRSMEAKAVAQIRQAAAGNRSLQSKGASYVRKPPPPHLKPGSSAFSRMRKKLYNA
jgi:hypothetical protein